MLVSPNFKSLLKENGDLVLERQGELTKVVIPEDIKRMMKFEADIIDNQIVFKQGSSVHIVTDKFALATNLEEVEANIFFINDGVILELLSGQLILFDENNEPFIVDQDGEIDTPRKRVRTRVVTHSDLRSNAEMIIKHRYGLEKQSDIEAYVNNLLMTTVASYHANREDPCLTIRIDAMYEDLGNETFNFVNYKAHAEFINKKDDDGHVDISDLDSEEFDEEEEDEFKMDLDGEDEE